MLVSDSGASSTDCGVQLYEQRWDGMDAGQAKPGQTREKMCRRTKRPIWKSASSGLTYDAPQRARDGRWPANGIMVLPFPLGNLQQLHQSHPPPCGARAWYYGIIRRIIRGGDVEEKHLVRRSGRRHSPAQKQIAAAMRASERVTARSAGKTILVLGWQVTCSG